MIPDAKAIRRKTLEHCLWLAEFDETYARSAAKDYERLAAATGWPELFVGLKDRFDTDLSRTKAAKAEGKPQ